MVLFTEHLVPQPLQCGHKCQPMRLLGHEALMATAQSIKVKPRLGLDGQLRRIWTVDTKLEPHDGAIH